MRRNDREITDNSKIEAFIQKEDIIRVAFYDKGDIFIVPVNYGFRKEKDSYVFFFTVQKQAESLNLPKSLQKLVLKLTVGMNFLKRI